MDVEKAKQLSAGDKVFINFKSHATNEVIQCWGVVSHGGTDVYTNSLGKEYVWISVKYLSKESVISSNFLETKGC